MGYYPFGHCIVCPSPIDGLILPLWPLYCLSSDLWLVIISLVIVFSVLRFMACYYLFGHCIVCPSQIYGLLLPLWPLYCLSFSLRFMACYYTFGHCIVCPSPLYRLSSDLLLVITSLAIVLCPSQIYGLLLHLWSLYCLSFSDLWLVIASLAIVLSVLFRFMACYYTFGHCIVCPSQIYGLLLPLWPLYCLSFSD